MHRVRLVSKGTGRQQPVGLCIANDAIHLFTEEGSVRPHAHPPQACSALPHERLSAYCAPCRDPSAPEPACDGTRSLWSAWRSARLSGRTRAASQAAWTCRSARHWGHAPCTSSPPRPRLRNSSSARWRPSAPRQRRGPRPARSTPARVRPRWRRPRAPRELGSGRTAAHCGAPVRQT